MMIRLLNVRGLTEDKYLELCRLFFNEKGGEYNLVCLTETHHRVEKINVGDGLFSFSVMRKERKKGGGDFRFWGR